MRGDKWRELAACKGQDTNKYIPEKKDSKDTIHYDKTTCSTCPVKQECLDFAIINKATKGLWGGTTPKEREKMYSSYKGERHYELDLDRILFPRKPTVRVIPVEDNPKKTTDRDVCDPLAVNAPIYFSWVAELFIQSSLFDE